MSQKHAPRACYLLVAVIDARCGRDTLWIRRRDQPSASYPLELPSPADLLVISGHYRPQPPFPTSPGYDAVGTVRSCVHDHPRVRVFVAPTATHTRAPDQVITIGAGVTAVAVGDVVALMETHGGMTTHIELPAARVFRVPAGVNPSAAVAVVLTGVTAYQVRRGVREATPRACGRRRHWRALPQSISGSRCICTHGHWPAVATAPTVTGGLRHAPACYSPPCTLTDCPRGLSLTRPPPPPPSPRLSHAPPHPHPQMLHRASGGRLATPVSAS